MNQKLRTFALVFLLLVVFGVVGHFDYEDALRSEGEFSAVQVALLCEAVPAVLMGAASPAHSGFVYTSMYAQQVEYRCVIVE